MIRLQDFMAEQTFIIRYNNVIKFKILTLNVFCRIYDGHYPLRVNIIILIQPLFANQLMN